MQPKVAQSKRVRVIESGRGVKQQKLKARGSEFAEDTEDLGGVGGVVCDQGDSGVKDVGREGLGVDGHSDDGRLVLFERVVVHGHSDSRVGGVDTANLKIAFAPVSQRYGAAERAAVAADAAEVDRGFGELCDWCFGELIDGQLGEILVDNCSHGQHKAVLAGDHSDRVLDETPLLAVMAAEIADGRHLLTRRNDFRHKVDVDEGRLTVDADADTVGAAVVSAEVDGFHLRLLDLAEHNRAVAEAESPHVDRIAPGDARLRADDHTRDGQLHAPWLAVGLHGDGLCETSRARRRVICH